MKKLSFLALVCILVSCSSTKKGSQDASNNAAWSYKQEKASTSVNDFIRDMRQDVGDGELSSYVPTESAQRKYGLTEIDSQYFIGGIAKVSKEYKASDFESFNLRVETNANPILTLKVPVYQLVNLLNSPHLIYFENNSAIKQR